MITKKKYQVIALYGASGSGKDTILKWIVSHYPKINLIVSCTTRPPREGEVDGVDYHFISEEKFTEQVMNGEMLEATEFRGWFYGTQASALSEETVNIGVFNPAGLMALEENAEIELLKIFVDASDKTRMLRCLNREKNPNVDEIVRRYQTDKRDLKEYFAETDIMDRGYYLDNDNLDLDRLSVTTFENIMDDWATLFKLLR
jgi:guanylate kinase